MNLDEQRVKRDMAFMITELRAMHGLSPQAFADKVGLHRPAVYRMESGKHHITMQTLQKIAKAFDSHVIPPSIAILPKPISYKKYL